MPGQSRVFVERNVKFFQLHSQEGELSNAGIFDLVRNLNQRIESLEPANRYIEDLEGNRQYVLIDNIPLAGGPIQMRFGRTTTRGLPSREKKLQIRSIQLEDDDDQEEGITYIAHTVIFSDAVIGVESNSSAPVSTQIANFLTQMIGMQLKLVPLLHPRVAERLANVREYTALKMSVKSDLLPQMQDSSDDLVRSVGNLNVRGAEEIEIVIKVNARKSNARLDSVGNAMRFFGAASRRSFVNSLSIKGRVDGENRIQEIDWFSEVIIARTQMTRVNSSSREVLRESAYAAIGSAYAENSELIDQSIRGRVEN